jgi:hypothetical protein
MISISTPHQPNWKCDSCKYPNKHNTHTLIDIGEESIFLCLDCAETLGIMLLDHVRDENE